ncbi:class I SAM-dependent methyltransferase [Sneathiella limimaris]|uniref:class I SAM-dependent methyltransferase n=1 Tax=Sneathiella limimaris TaxID=1964213 RepID=UPI00146C8B46|nr:class I SAM-dependent methyltransferase [Sneathiella limimaris]
MTQISEWLQRHYSRIRPGGTVLDLAAGSGRHSVYLADRGYQVTAVDIETRQLEELGRDDIEILQADLENEPWPLEGRRFDGIIVTHYLWRPLFPKIRQSLTDGGVIIYETFAEGNERFGRPRNPDFLLKDGELKEQLSGFDILDYHHSIVTRIPVSLRQGVVARVS